MEWECVIWQNTESFTSTEFEVGCDPIPELLEEDFPAELPNLLPEIPPRPQLEMKVQNTRLAN